MTLQEFIASHDNRGFVEEKVKAMRFHVELCELAIKENSYFDFKMHLDTVNENYYAVYGYIMAARTYNYISSEESRSLLNELRESSKPKM